METTPPPPLPELQGLSKERLDDVVEAVKQALSNPELRALGQRAVQGKIWHGQPIVAQVLSDLRQEEELVRSQILACISRLVYLFHEHATDVTLARAGLTLDARVHAGSSLHDNEAFDLFCLDAKERLYMTLQSYEWLQDFFRLYPLHFYENSFQFVERIPKKKLQVKVKVIGLGIGGSVAVSGLAKHGIVVQGYEKRAESGPRCVTSRYQNASWRAYDIAGKLVDDQAYETLMENRQRINVTYDDGSTAIVTSDRVQIIIGAAIQSALDSARRYGAELHFKADESDYCGEDNDECDIVALFCGAHTSQILPGLEQAMNIYSWNDTLDSTCKMWLRIRPSKHTDAYCTRGGEIGAEQWHYTIASARSTTDDILRVMDNLDAQYRYNVRKLEQGNGIGTTEEELSSKYGAQKAQLTKTLETVTKNPGMRFDYIFTNAPLNEHNVAKRNEAAQDGTVVLDGGYTVELQITSQSTVTQGELLKELNTKLIVCGGDACVPPNPLAAYGATLACEAAGSLVQLSVAIGHINAILAEMNKFDEHIDDEWIQQVQDLKTLVTLYYEARGRAENYFQWVQTLICNMYSLPPFY